MNDHQHEYHATTRDIEVRGEYMRASGPLILPAHRCVRCGSTEPGGEIRNDIVTYVNPWIWLTVFISWVVTWIVYLVSRKQIEVQYYLCPRCADRRKIRTVTSSAVTGVSMFGIIAAGVLGEWTLMMPMIGAFFVSSIAWMITSSPPLRAVVHDDGRFSLKGASRSFLDSIDSRQLPGPTRRALPAGDDW